MQTRYQLLGTLVLVPALLFAPAAWAKACQENTGGACKGHWQCDDNDTAKVCTDNLTRSGYECICAKPAKKRVLQPSNMRGGNFPVLPHTPQTEHPTTQRY
jgi:hypothetical protein